MTLWFWKNIHMDDIIITAVSQRWMSLTEAPLPSSVCPVPPSSAPGGYRRDRTRMMTEPGAHKQPPEEFHQTFPGKLLLACKRETTPRLISNNKLSLSFHKRPGKEIRKRQCWSGRSLKSTYLLLRNVSLSSTKAELRLILFFTQSCSPARTFNAAL